MLRIIRLTGVRGNAHLNKTCKVLLPEKAAGIPSSLNGH
nr:MAG TPA: hypothetical protein [Caudoviricetes sp.]